MQLIPAIVMVRFHRLLLPATNRRSPTRKRRSVRVRYGPPLRAVCCGCSAFLIQKRRKSIRGFHTRSLKIFAASLAAPSSRTQHAKPYTQRTLGSIPKPSAPWMVAGGRHFPVKERPSGLRGFATRVRKNFAAPFAATSSRAQRSQPYTHKIWFDSKTIHATGGRRRHGIFPVKEETFGSPTASTLERGYFFSRGASGEAMTHRGGSAMSPFV